jgi:hypothetical protein
MVAPFGPFIRGVVDSANPSLGLTGAMRACENAILTGINRLSVRPGSVVAMTLLDDQGSPAPVTSVRHVGPFADGMVAIGYSSVTQKVYLYRLDALATGWYAATSGTFTTASAAHPVCVIWTGATVPPDVCVTEGLGTLYIANTVASDASGLYWPTKTYTDFSSTVSNLSASGTDGSSAGTDTAYFNGVIAFQQALFGWGYGAGNTAGTAFRPEMIRFSPPSFGNLQTADSLTLGDKVRSLAERVVGAGLAGQACYFGGSNLLTRVTGYGRDSWYREPVDRSYGFVGPKCMVTVGDTLYYWSRRGPLRVDGVSSPEPLWDALPATVNGIVNSSKIVAGFDPDRDQVRFHYDTGTGVRCFAAFDVRRDVWLGPASDLGVAVACAGVVQPYTSSTATPPAGPSGPPTTPSTTAIGQTTATANWVNGDPTAATEVSYQPQGGSTWTVVATQAAGTTSYTFTGLLASAPYQWRVRHVLNGQFSAYLGPVSATQWTDLADTSALQPPTNLNVAAQSPKKACYLTWTNSGESGVSTVIERSSDGTTFSAATTVGPGIASQSVPVFAYGTWYFRVKHVKSGATDSAYSAVASDTVSALV